MAFYNEKNDPTNFVISFSSNPQNDFGVFAEGYRNAASQLAKNLLNKKYFRDFEAYPVVFLYRQAFELYLKAFFYEFILIHLFSYDEIKWEKFVNRHPLTPLANFFVKSCEKYFPDDSELIEKANEIKQTAIEFDQIDPGSYGYRYPINTKGDYSTDKHQIVNLSSFHENMEQIMDDLKIFDLGLNMEADKRQEIFELLEEVKDYLEID